MPRTRVAPGAPLSPLARRIVERQDALGLLQADIARGAGLKPQTLSRLLCGQHADVRDRRVIERLARTLKTTSAWLEGTTTDPAIPPPPRRVRAPVAPRPALSADEIAEYEADAQREAEEAALRADDPLEDFVVSALASPVGMMGAQAGARPRSVRAPIPLYAERTDDGICVQTPVKSIPRPPLLIGRPGAYAIVAGDGFEPRYRSHETQYVATGLVARPGDWVVAITRVPVGAGAFRLVGHIGSLIGLTRARLVLSSENARPETILASNSLHALHLVVLSGEADLAVFTEAGRSRTRAS